MDERLQVIRDTALTNPPQLSPRPRQISPRYRPVSLQQSAARFDLTPAQSWLNVADVEPAWNRH